MIQKIGSLVIKFISGSGSAAIFAIDALSKAFTPPFRPRLTINQIKSMGADSFFVVALVGLFTGAVLAVQAVYAFNKFGATAYTGSAVALSLIRELGPVLSALMVNGRAGSAMCAELGIMKITEQTDALRAMNVDPIRYLMTPRMLAGIISMPLLCCIFDVVGIFGGYAIGVWNLGLPSGTFIEQIISSLKPIDVWSGLVKSLLFGFIISWTACYKGWTTKFGATGVNNATTSAVVTASVAILVIDYFLTSILTVVTP